MMSSVVTNLINGQTTNVYIWNKFLNQIKFKFDLCFGIFFCVVTKLDVLDGVGIFVGGDESQVIEDIVLLEVLLGQILKVTLLEIDLGCDSDLIIKLSYRKGSR